MSIRLGEERTRAHDLALEGEGTLCDLYRERKLLDYYLEPAAQKNGLTISETNLLIHLRRCETGSWRELADFAGVSRRTLSVLLQRLEAKGLVSAEETRTASGGREKQLNVTFQPAAEPVLEELRRAYEDFEEARLSGLDAGERAQYSELTRRIQDNTRELLTSTAARPSAAAGSPGMGFPLQNP